MGKVRHTGTISATMLSVIVIGCRPRRVDITNHDKDELLKHQMNSILLDITSLYILTQELLSCKVNAVRMNYA